MTRSLRRRSIFYISARARAGHFHCTCVHVVSTSYGYAHARKKLVCSRAKTGDLAVNIGRPGATLGTRETPEKPERVGRYAYHVVVGPGNEIGNVAGGASYLSWFGADNGNCYTIGFQG